MEEELPAFFAEDPERGAVGDGGEGGGVVGCQDYAFGEWGDVEVADGGCAWRRYFA